MLNDPTVGNDIISNFIQIEKFEKKLEFVQLHMGALDGEQKKQFESRIRKFDNLMEDVDFMRRLKYRDSLVERHPVEYFGQDYDEDPFAFDEDMEQDILILTRELKDILSEIINVTKNANIHISDET